MNRRKAPRALVVLASALLAQAGVQRSAAAASPPPSLPPPDAPQYPGTPPAPPPVPPVPMSATDQLVAPIALYPDPLIALILPASTVPADLLAAQAYLVQYGDKTRIDRQPWDPSVRALAHYPAVIGWMADNPEWTQALGAAFLASPADVMESIQRLRARALAAGVLASTPQQRVYSDNGEIEILPGQPDSVTVPAYDADTVYLLYPGDGYGGAFINYGPALDAGPWLSYCVDWEGGGIWVGGWSAWHGPEGWYRPHFRGRHGPPGAQPWRPTGGAVTPPRRAARADPVPHPRPMQGAPAGHPVPQAASAARPPARLGEVDFRPGVADTRYGAPEAASRGREGSPALSKAPAAAPASHPAPGPSAPAASPSSTSVSASSDPRNH